ncbi:MAG: T9SS type A sorting domain-containing protein [Panacibacter sp.]
MKTKHLLMLLFLAAILQNASGQIIAKNQADIGGTANDYLTKLCGSQDGGILLAGYSNSNRSKFKKEDSRGSYDYWVVKASRNEVDGSIKIQWEKTIGGDSIDNLIKAIPTTDGGYLLCGNSLSGKSGEKTESRVGGYDYWLVKLDKDGVIEWDKTIGEISDDYLADLDQTTDGGYILVGSLGLMKIDDAGNIQWRKTGYYAVYRSVQHTKDGGYILTGLNETRTILMTKTDGMGNIEWTKNYGWAGWIWDYGAIQGNNGGFIFYQRGAYSYSQSGDYYYDFFIHILKSDGLGNQQWTYDPYPLPDLAGIVKCSLQQTSDQGFIFETSSSSINPNYYIIKINNNGQLQWTKTIGASMSEICTDLLEITPNHYIVGGYSNSDISGDKTKTNLGDFDFWIVGLKDIPGSVNATNTLAATASVGKVAKEMLVYPNPTKNILHIQNTGKAKFTLTNQSGKILLSKTISGNGEINVAHLPAGLYYLKNNETGEVQKVIIAK